MKTLKFLSYTVFVLFLSIAITSCSGDDGATGPAGPAGADGADGIDGNANVIASDWFNATWPTNTSATYATFTHDAPELTQDILDSGVILVYMKTSNAVYPLPISFIGDSNPKEYDFWANLGSIRIWFTAESAITPSSTKQFRYVIIPSNNTAARGTSTVDVNDYYAVCEYYGINPE